MLSLEFDSMFKMFFFFMAYFHSNADLCLPFYNL